MSTVDDQSITARTSSELRLLNSLPSSLISVPPYLVTSTRSPFFISKGTFLPLSSVLPVPSATIRLSMGFSLAVSGIIIPPFLSSFSSTASTRIRSPMGLTFSVIVCHFFCLYSVSSSHFHSLMVFIPLFGCLGDVQDHINRS